MSIEPYIPPTICAVCGAPLAFDGFSYIHADGGAHGHRADVGDEYRERQRRRIAAVKARRLR